MTYGEFKPGVKIIDKVEPDGKRLDGQIMECYRDAEGKEYFANKKFIWPISEFDLEDFEIYTGDLPVGAYLK